MADRDGMFGLDPIEQRHAYVSGIQRIPRALARLEVPLIAAVNGPAIGAGCDLAMMCDIRVASERASFAESFVQIGLVPGRRRHLVSPACHRLRTGGGDDPDR